ncbi:MAG: Crp/Fnr family transcriptional regulator [Flavobacteriales bacterium]|nr:Crp/Fnr family transcriptional regulator [Flavobacteriales bacterium]MBP7449645.1 Crp/Fnr family transcriptional regulator [Flavobacteriales bacterium]
MEDEVRLRKAMAGLDAALIDAMIAKGRCVEVPAKVELLHEGGYVKELPVVLDGLVRVYIGHEEKELLLYHIRPAESCVMSFSALLGRSPSRINAVTERPSHLLLVPEVEVRGWLRDHPSFADLMFKLYDERYADMLRTVEQVAFGDLPTRLLDHLHRMAGVNGSEWLDVRHSKLAQELGSAREVITRTLKKLERDGRVEVGEQGLRVR